MKALAIIAALAVTPAAGQSVDYCASIANLGKSVAENRIALVPLSELVKRVLINPDIQPVQLDGMITFVVNAYNIGLSPEDTGALAFDLCMGGDA